MNDKFVVKPFGNTLARLGEIYKELVVVDADLQRATETELFQAQFPDRYFDVGIAEANMVSISAGLALSGKTVFCGTFSSFITQRVADQVVMSVAYCHANVKLIGVEPGLASGRNGASHQAFGDLAIMRAIPNMQVYDPGDATETSAIMRYMMENPGPAYMRVPRGNTPVIFDATSYQFQAGRSCQMTKGKDVTVIAAGIMLPRAIEALKILEKKNISASLINMSSIKPIDEELIIKAARETGCIVVAENHSIYGGLGGAVAEVVTSYFPVPVVRIGIQDKFGEVGSIDWLADKYMMNSQHIAEGAVKACNQKR